MYDLSGYITLEKIWSDYQVTRKLKPKTLHVYKNCIHRCFLDWLELPANLITKDMVEQRHRELSSINSKLGTGAAQADLAMRILKALLTYASYKYDQLGDLATKNPVRRLSELRTWNKVPRRKRYITAEQMPSWFAAVLSVEHTNRDYNLLLLLTGMRKSEAGGLRWSGVDFRDKTLYIKDTKNGSDLLLPMSSHVEHILKRRQEIEKIDSTYVFTFLPEAPLSKDYRGYETVVERWGRPYHFHDLRRTYATNADALDIEDAVIKRLLNHKTNDVTVGYFCNGVERLRSPMQEIGDRIVRQALPERLPGLSSS